MALLACDWLEDEAKDAHISKVQAIPSNSSIDAGAGETFEVALQALDSKDDGLDGVDCFFAISDLSTLSFESAAPGEATRRVVTQSGTAGGLHSHGLAVARIVPADVTERHQALIWAGVTSSEWSDEATLADSSQILQFAVTVAPRAAAPEGAAE